MGILGDRILATNRWRFINVDYLIPINVDEQSLSVPCRWKLVEKGPLQATHFRQTCQGRASCLRRTQLVGSSVELTTVQTCSGSREVG